MSYTHILVDKLEDLNRILDASTIKPNWMIYSKKFDVTSTAQKYFPVLAPILLIFRNGVFIGGAHNDKNRGLIVYGLIGGEDITKTFTEDELKQINIDLQRQGKPGEEVLDSTT